MPKVLVSDKLAQEGIDILSKAADVDVITGLTEDQLCEIIANYDALVIRSGTTVTSKILQHASKLKIIGRAGVGVDNVDVAGATEKGIVVCNSPGGNTLAAAELSMAMLLALARNIPQAHMTMREKTWNRSKFTGNELYAKTIGILGLGKIGQSVAKRCQAFGMKTISYDPFLTQELADQLGVELVSLEEAFKRSDFISLHLPKNKETTNLISKAQFDIMKNGVRIVNCARGGIIDDLALIEALKNGKCAGAALDVYLTEPPDFSSELFELPNVITTPHLGASTEEAQTNVAIDVAEQIVEVFIGGNARSAVNMPALSADVLAVIKPFLPLAEKVASLAAQTITGRPNKIEISYCGELAGINYSPITRYVIVGLLKPAVGDTVNAVNAPLMAKTRGIEISEIKSSDSEDYNSMLKVNIKTDKGDFEVAGTLFGAKEPKIIKMGEFQMDITPEGVMLVSKHHDVPGVIGQVGGILGNHGINIASMYVGRKGVGKMALMALGVDSEVPKNILDELQKLDAMESIKQVVF